MGAGDFTHCLASWQLEWRFPSPPPRCAFGRTPRAAPVSSRWRPFFGWHRRCGSCWGGGDFAALAAGVAVSLTSSPLRSRARAPCRAPFSAAVRRPFFCWRRAPRATRGVPPSPPQPARARPPWGREHPWRGGGRRGARPAAAQSALREPLVPMHLGSPRVLLYCRRAEATAPDFSSTDFSSTDFSSTDFSSADFSSRDGVPSAGAVAGALSEGPPVWRGQALQRPSGVTASGGGPGGGGAFIINMEGAKGPAAAWASSARRVRYTAAGRGRGCVHWTEHAPGYYMCRIQQGHVGTRCARLRACTPSHHAPVDHRFYPASESASYCSARRAFFLSFFAEGGGG